MVQLRTKGTSKKIISLCMKNKHERNDLKLLLDTLNNMDDLFNWEYQNYMIFKNKNLESYFATVTIDKKIGRNEMPTEILDMMTVIMVNFKPKENIIFTIDGLNLLLIEKLGVIDETHNID
jgi:hypothetical protein